MSKTLATLILAAQAYRENSWKPSQTFSAGGYYSVELSHAIAVVCNGNKELEPVVTMLLTNSWNESADWAKTYLTDHPDDRDEKNAFHHLRAVSGSRNCFELDSLPLVNGFPQLPRRSQEVQDMHSAAARYLANREAALKQLGSLPTSEVAETSDVPGETNPLAEVRAAFEVLSAAWVAYKDTDEEMNTQIARLANALDQAEVLIERQANPDVEWE